MQGYLYNILGDGIEELYWSPEEIDNKTIQVEYEIYISDVFSDEYGFEDWIKDRTNLKLERVFLEEIYV